MARRLGFCLAKTEAWQEVFESSTWRCDGKILKTHGKPASGDVNVFFLTFPSQNDPTINFGASGGSKMLPEARSTISDGFSDVWDFFWDFDAF